MDRPELLQQARRLAAQEIENADPGVAWVFVDDLAERDPAAAIRAVASALLEVAARTLIR